MGRPVKNIDTEVYYDLASMGMTQKDIAEELGITVPTLTRRIADIQEKQGLLLKYRELQSLQLTELQARVLEAITPEKIAGASLKELVGAFKILKEKELVVDGKPSDIQGLVGYLLHIEKEERGLQEKIVTGASARGIDITDAEVTREAEEELRLEEAEELEEEVFVDNNLPKL